MPSERTSENRGKRSKLSFWLVESSLLNLANVDLEAILTFSAVGHVIDPRAMLLLSTRERNDQGGVDHHHAGWCGRPSSTSMLASATNLNICVFSALLFYGS